MRSRGQGPSERRRTDWRQCRRRRRRYAAIVHGATCIMATAGTTVIISIICFGRSSRKGKIDLEDMPRLFHEICSQREAYLRGIEPEPRPGDDESGVEKPFSWIAGMRRSSSSGSWRRFWRNFPTRWSRRRM
ncbi:MAG: hypothetical protein ACLR8P_05455 [Clostridium fessum]